VRRTPSTPPERAGGALLCCRSPITPDELAPAAAVPGEVTVLLRAWAAGAPDALDQLLPLVYDELRRLAGQRLRRERQGHTLQPTALVHEAFLRLVGYTPGWQDRQHFFAVAAQVMRRVAVDHARRRQAQRRGGGDSPLLLDLAAVAEPGAESIQVDLLALDEALGRLQQMDAQQARVVELRFFTGLSIDETAAALGISAATVWRDWKSAKLWLYREIAR
jgi:RNA polymerase sigma-70 factor (ECF subfamily)